MSGMKTLIAATCIAVLAAAGYFFYGEYAEASARSEARGKLATIFTSPESDDEVMRQCLLAASDARNNKFRFNASMQREVVATCKTAGF